MSSGTGVGAGGSVHCGFRDSVVGAGVVHSGFGDSVVGAGVVHSGFGEGAVGAGEGDVATDSRPTNMPRKKTARAARNVTRSNSHIWGFKELGVSHLGGLAPLKQPKRLPHRPGGGGELSGGGGELSGECPTLSAHWFSHKIVPSSVFICCECLHLRLFPLQRWPHFPGHRAQTRPREGGQEGKVANKPMFCSCRSRRRPAFAPPF